MTVSQHAAQHVLRTVRILILIDVDVLEFLLVKVEDFRHFLEQLNGCHNEIVEVERIVGSQTFWYILYTFATMPSK